jgi:hypothetical protein
MHRRHYPDLPPSQAPSYHLQAEERIQPGQHVEKSRIREPQYRSGTATFQNMMAMGEEGLEFYQTYNQIRAESNHSVLKDDRECSPSFGN